MAIKIAFSKPKQNMKLFLFRRHFCATVKTLHSALSFGGPVGWTFNLTGERLVESDRTLCSQVFCFKLQFDLSMWFERIKQFARSWGCFTLFSVEIQTMCSQEQKVRHPGQQGIAVSVGSRLCVTKILFCCSKSNHFTFLMKEVSAIKFEWEWERDVAWKMFSCKSLSRTRAKTFTFIFDVHSPKQQQCSAFHVTHLSNVAQLIWRLPHAGVFKEVGTFKCKAVSNFWVILQIFYLQQWCRILWQLSSFLRRIETAQRCWTWVAKKRSLVSMRTRFNLIYPRKLPLSNWFAPLLLHCCETQLLWRMVNLLMLRFWSIKCAFSVRDHGTSCMPDLFRCTCDLWQTQSEKTKQLAIIAKFGCGRKGHSSETWYNHRRQEGKFIAATDTKLSDITSGQFTTVFPLHFMSQ